MRERKSIVVRNRVGWMVVGLMVLAGNVSSQAFARKAVTPPAIKPDKKKIVALVRTEFNYVEAMDRAKKAISEKNYPRAIQFLQGLIEKKDGGFYPAGAHRFVPLQVEANRLLGTLPAEGLSEYRKLYDPKAEGKLANAIEQGDLAGVRQVTLRYRHTTVGRKALRTLAEMQLDYGRYAAASVTFGTLLDEAFAGKSGARADAPELLALRGVAETMSGRFDVARKTAAKLKKTAPDATADWGGESMVLSQWLVKFIAQRAKTHRSPVLAGSPQASATMVLSPRWRSPMDPEDPDSLLIPEALTASTGIMGGGGETKLKQGEVSILSSGGNNYHLRGGFGSSHISSSQGPTNAMKLPPYIVPTLVDDTLVYRDDEAVHAVDRETGEVVWRTGWSLPMARTKEQTNSNSNRHVYYGGASSLFALDQGRYRVSSGGGRLFCVYNFARPQVNRNTGVMSDIGASSLAAISIRSQGKLLWSVGHDGLSNAGDTVLAETMYLSLPTYVPVSGAKGRLLVLGIHKQRYVALCLDAQTGRRIWHTDISQVPQAVRSYRLTPFDAIRFAGAKPQLSGDTVVINTNNGVIAAVDIDTGQPRWAYQYVLNIEKRISSSGMLGIKQSAQLSPVVIAGDTVVVLPSDHNQVLALSLAEGKKQWEQPRGLNLQIAPIDDERILILGHKQAVVASSKTGKTLAHRKVVGTPKGCPAQVGGGIYFCASGWVYRLDLTTYTMQKSGPVSQEGLLGNLVAGERTLYAANSLGLCRYSDVEMAMQEIAKKLTDAMGLEKIELLQQRSGFRAIAKQHAAALEDLLRARTLVDALDESDQKRLLPQLNAKLYLAQVAAGNAATGNKAEETRQSCFDEAMKLATTNSQKVHMWIRLAKLAEQRKQYAHAVQIAHKIETQYGRELVVDVAIGPTVDSSKPLDSSKSKLTARAWAMGNGKFIDTLLKTHGQEHYAVFDGQAKVAFDAAKLAGDPGGFQAVEGKFPRSKWVTPTRFAEAEIWFSRINQPGKEGKVAHAKSKRLLEDVFSSPKTATPSMRLNAAVGLYHLYTKEGIRFGASDDLRDLMDDTDDKTPVKFGQLAGPLGTVRKQIEDGKVPGSDVVAKPASVIKKSSWPTISVPLTNLHDITDDAPVMVTDQLGNPAVVDGAVLVWQGKELALVDIAAKGEKQIRWKADAEALAPKPIHNRRMPIYLGMTLVARVVQGGTRIVVAGQDRVVSFDSKTGKIVWTHELEEAGMVRRAAIDDRQVVVAGVDQIEVISAKTGKLQWAGQVSGKLNNGGRLLPPVVLLPGSVVIQSESERQVMVYDRISGKRVGEINASGIMTFAPASDATILVVDGQQVRRVRIDTKKHKLHTTEVEVSLLVQRGEDKNRGPLYRAIIGSGPGGIIVGNNSGGEVSAEWIQFSGSQVRVQPLSLPSQTDGEVIMTAAAAHVWNDRVVIWANRSRQLLATRGIPTYFSGGMWGFGFQSGKSKPTWTTQLGSPDKPTHIVPSHGLQGKTHLIWLQRKYANQAWTNQLMVLDYRTGAVVQQPKLQPGNAANSGYQMNVQPLCIRKNIVLSQNNGLSIWSQKNEKQPASKPPAKRGK